MLVAPVGHRKYEPIFEKIMESYQFGNIDLGANPENFPKFQSVFQQKFDRLTCKTIGEAIWTKLMGPFTFNREHFQKFNQ